MDSRDIAHSDSGQTDLATDALVNYTNVKE